MSDPRPERGFTLLEIMIVLAILALVMGLLVGPQVLKLFGEGKVDIARAGAKKLAFESYPQWSSRPANTGKCPTAAQLAEYGGAPKDPWGEEYVIKCTDLPPGAVGIAVSSHGEIYDRANVLLPIRSGSYTLRMSVPSSAKKVKIGLLEGGTPKGDAQTLDIE